MNRKKKPIEEIKETMEIAKKYLNLRIYLALQLVVMVIYFLLGRVVEAMVMLVILFVGLIIHDKYKEKLYVEVK